MPQTPSISDKPKITGEIMIADLVDNFPEVVDYLVTEYGFHCVSCFISSFECLEDGARVHGIEGDEFAEMLVNINRLISGDLEAGEIVADELEEFQG